MKTRRAFRPFAAGAIALLAVVSALGTAALPAATRKPQQAASAAPGPVTVLFRALLPDGRPFADVRAEDVELKVDGRVRTIGSLAFVQPGSSSATLRPRTASAWSPFRAAA